MSQWSISRRVKSLPWRKGHDVELQSWRFSEWIFNLVFSTVHAYKCLITSWLTLLSVQGLSHELFLEVFIWHFLDMLICIVLTGGGGKLTSSTGLVIESHTHSHVIIAQHMLLVWWWLRFLIKCTQGWSQRVCKSNSSRVDEYSKMFASRISAGE